jgi:hypothetical protein
VSKPDVFEVQAPALGSGVYDGRVNITFWRSHERAQQFADSFGSLSVANMSAAPDVHGNMVVAWHVETNELREAVEACV